MPNCQGPGAGSGALWLQPSEEMQVKDRSQNCGSQLISYRITAWWQRCMERSKTGSVRCGGDGVGRILPFRSYPVGTDSEQLTQLTIKKNRNGKQPPVSLACFREVAATLPDDKWSRNARIKPGWWTDPA
ncbi:hypothetical protein UVI_02025960 [Ustilaginoidea virens]|uniref:Uncharacterized protein n=1 Tax=Ustilaginoidea virens TaxID=1159556 RepID=A0A1B5KRG2_USTVR|nr:hypothetical protein UVI_02025960 [Ustilaginoidea virens]